MNAPAPINPKVRRVLPMCGSPVDAEALSACRRVGTILAKDGLSYVDLAAAVRVAGDPSPADTSSRGPVWDDRAWRMAAGRARPHRRRAYTFTPAQSGEHRRMALWVRNNDRGRLSCREREFIADISHQRRELTIAQADWLAVICERLALEERRAC